MPARILIASDADVRGLIGCAAAAREHGPGQLVWLPSGADRQLLPQCQESVRSQAELYEHVFIETPDRPVAATSPGEHQTRLLLEAAYLAAANGLDSVMWVGGAGGDEHDLDALAGLHGRAMLIERLVELDFGGVLTGGFRIQVPYADLTDRQLADLVLDMDLPIWTCWWWALGRGPRGQAGADVARSEYERWDEMLKEAGWREGMPGPATIG